MPHPSALNAYPAAPGFYPSGPDNTLVSDTGATGSRTGSPQHIFQQFDTATGSRTETPSEVVSQVINVADVSGASRTGNVATGSVSYGVTVTDKPLHATLPSASTLPSPAQLPLYTLQAEQSVTGRPVDAWSVEIPDRATGSLSRTVIEATAGPGVIVRDTATGSNSRDTTPVTLVTDKVIRDVAGGSWSRTSTDKLDRGLADIPAGQRTGLPVQSLLSGAITFDTVTGSRTGSPPSGASVEIVDSGGGVATAPFGTAPFGTAPFGGSSSFSPVGGGGSATARTGLPFEGSRPVWKIWPDVTGISRTVTPTTVYSVALADRTGTAQSLTGRTAGEQFVTFYPVSTDPRTVTIFDYNYPGPTLYPGGPFYPGLSVPFGQLIPARIDPFAAAGLALRYRLYLADTITGRIAYELPYEQITWSTKLNNIGTLTASVVVQHVYDALSDADERDPRSLFAQFLSSGALRYSLVLTYGNTVVWAGPYTPTSVPGNAPIISLGGSDFGSLLQRRLLVGVDPPGINSDVGIGPNTKPGLALQLVEYATGAAAIATTPLVPLPRPPDNAWLLPWGCADQPSKAGSEWRTYYGYDLWTVWDALSSLSQEHDGPDFRFDPTLIQGADGNYLHWNMVIGRPVLATPHEWGWDAPTTAAVGWDTNVSNFGTHYYGTGSGQDRSKLVAIAKSYDLLNAGYPVTQLTDTLHSSVTDQAELQALIDGDLAAFGRPSNRWTITVQASQPPLLGSYRVGDTVQLRVEQHPVIPDGVYHRRITSLTGDSSDVVTITSSDSLLVQSTTSSGVQVITSD